ncbi:MAG: hypothetical protein CMJ78_07675, partial [Planctomycetaceae bacterium]|nr:hypothetical protein [Planctomycetaceae bacterium]
SFAGKAVDGLPSIKKMASSDSKSLQVSAAFPGKVGSGFTEVAVRRKPQYVLTATSSPVISTRAGLSGVFRKPGEVHSCKIATTRGRRLRIRDVSRSKGAPALIAMLVQNDVGRELASLRRGGTVGSELLWTVKGDGEFTLLLSELNGRGGSEFAYHVEIEEVTPGFELTAELDSSILPQNGYALLKVTAKRNQYNGPIALNVVGLGDVELRNQVIAEKKNDTRLKIYVPAKMQPGQTRGVEVIGTATVDGQRVERRASTLAANRKQIPQTPFPPSDLNGLIAASIGPEIPDFFGLSLDGGRMYFPRLVGEVYFTVRVKDRANGFKSPVNIRIEDLPPGFSAGGGESPVSRSENNEYRFLLRGPTNLNAQTATVRIVAEASFKGQTKEFELEKVQLAVIDPLQIKAEFVGPLKPGSRGQLKLIARRFVPRAGGDKKEINVQLEALQQYFKVPSTVTIPAGKSETSVEVVVGEKLPSKTVVITAQTIVGGEEVKASGTLAISSQ